MNQIDQSAIITGASSGLGLSLAKKLTQLGICVHGISKSQQHWATAKKEVGSLKQFSLTQLDATDEAAVRTYFSEFNGKGNRLNLLVNCAGYGGALSRVEDIKTEEFLNHISRNLISVFLMCKYAIPIFKSQNDGLIINIASMAGKRAVPRLAAYSASKFGVVALSQAIAKENEDTHVRCVAVCPGGMNTGMREQLFGKEDANAQQSADSVADTIIQVIQGKTPVDSGGDIVIRHGKVTAVNPVPAA